MWVCQSSRLIFQGLSLCLFKWNKSIIWIMCFFPRSWGQIRISTMSLSTSCWVCGAGRGSCGCSWDWAGTLRSRVLVWNTGMSTQRTWTLVKTSKNVSHHFWNIDENFWYTDQAVKFAYGDTCVLILLFQANTESWEMWKHLQFWRCGKCSGKNIQENIKEKCVIRTLSWLTSLVGCR